MLKHGPRAGDQHATRGWGLLLGPQPRLEETGLSSLAEITQSREAACLKCFYLIISNASSGMASGAWSETHWTSVLWSGSKGKLPALLLLPVGFWGCWSPASVEEEVVRHRCQKGSLQAALRSEMTQGFLGEA